MSFNLPQSNHEQLIVADVESLEFKDGENDDASIADALEKVNKGYEALKETQAAIEKEVKSGFADVVSKDKFDKIADDVVSIQEQLDKAIAKSNHLPVGQESKSGFSDEQIEHKNAFGSFLRGDITEEALLEKQKQCVEFKSLDTTGNGGIVVPTALSSTVVRKFYDGSPFRQMASVVSITTGDVEYLVDRDEASSGWVSEKEQRKETTTPTLGKITIPVHEMYSEPRVTQTFIDDAAIDAESWLTTKVVQDMIRIENSAFLIGDGVNKPRGLLTYPDGTDWQQVQQFKSGAAGQLPTSDPWQVFLEMMFGLKEHYQINASWLFNRMFAKEILSVRDADGRHLWQPSLTAGQPSTFLGAGTRFSADIPKPAANAIAGAYGDYKSAYQIVDRIDVRLLRDPFTAKPYIKFYFTKRVGGDVIDFDAYNTMVLKA